MNFVLKDSFKKFFCPYNPKTDPFKFFIGNLLSGGAAGATSLSVIYPLDFARIRLGADVGSSKTREFTGLRDCFSKVLAVDGVRGLYRGYVVSVFGIVFYRATYFGAFDTGKAFLFPNVKERS